MAGVSSTGRQRIYNVSLSCTEGNGCHQLVRTLLFAQMGGIRSLSVVTRSLTIEFVKSGRQGSSVTLMSIFLNRRVLPPKKREPSWSLFAV